MEAERPHKSEIVFFFSFPNTSVDWGDCQIIDQTRALA